MRITETKRFSQGWQFHSGDTPWWQPTGEKFDAVLNRWREVNLPHTYNAEDTFTLARGIYLGVCWYRKTFTLPQEASGRKVFLEFGAGFSLVDVWVNERHAGQFMGGYTGFTVDATRMVRPGENLIAVKVDNSHDPDILPGIEGKDMDYVQYGGLYREASLVIKDRLHIAQHGLTVKTVFLSPDRAAASVEVILNNDEDDEKECECAAVVRDPAGAVVAELTGRAKVAARDRAVVQLENAEVRNPKPWSPDQPNLYTVEVAVRADAEAVDADATTFGLRWFEFRADEGLYLNGRHLKLRGLNRHQDYPGLGNALPPRLQVRDAEILKEMGANFVRLSHYPQHPAFIDACDRLGIIVYEEIASWQHIGGEMFMRNAERMMREMIARDKNHPSILFWGLFNEGRSRLLFERLHQVAKECDPTRLSIYADNNPAEGKEAGSVFVPDVLGLNYKLPHLDEIRADLPGCKLVSTETTNYEHRRRGNCEMDSGQVKRIKADTDIIEARDYMAGMALWSMHDFATEYELSWPIQNSGVVDCYRLPKAGYWFLRGRWSAAPLVRILGHWNWPGKEGEGIAVPVCFNGDSVQLFLNDEPLGTKTERYLAEWQVPYAPGKLRAVAKCGDRTVEHTITTHTEPARLLVETSDEVIEAHGVDVAEITIRVVDRDGNPALTEDGHAVFRVEGPANIRGIGGIPCTSVLAGIGRIAVQATAEPGTVTVRAAYRGLPEVALRLKTV